MWRYQEYAVEKVGTFVCISSVFSHDAQRPKLEVIMVWYYLDLSQRAGLTKFMNAENNKQKKTGQSKF